MQKNYLFDEQTTPWFKTKTFKVIVLILAILSIASIVLFSEEIGNLLELFGLKAATETRTVLIDGEGIIPGSTMFLDGATLTPPDSFKVDDTTKRLMLNPIP